MSELLKINCEANDKGFENFLNISHKTLNNQALCKCRNWITKLDNKFLYFYGFLKSTLINNNATMEREKLHVG